jgi:thiosulfate reductase cytochrome b subunit
MAAGTIALPVVAVVHLAPTDLITIFVIIHIYMTMITGYDTIPSSKAEAAYLAEDEPGRLK